MKKFLTKRILPLLVSLSLFCLSITQVEPPPNWRSATIWQILVVLIPLLSSLTFFLNLLIYHFSRSFIISLTLLVIVVLNSLNELDIPNSALVITTGLILLVVLGNFRLLKLRQNKPKDPEPTPTFRSRRQTRIRSLSKLTTRK